MLTPAASRSLARSVCLLAVALLAAGCGSVVQDAPAGAIPGQAEQAAAIRQLSA